MAARRKDISEVQERPVSFRLPAAGRQKLLDTAAARGLTPGQLARELVARNLDIVVKAGHIRRAVANADILRRLLGELAVQGSNLNQIAHHLNRGGSRAEAVQDLEALRDAHKAALQAVVATLNRSRS